MDRLIRWLMACVPLAGCQHADSSGTKGRPVAAPLEQQLETLAQLGLTLNDGITVDDLLYSWDREEYEDHPYDTLLFMLGSEVERQPWGRHVSDHAWNFDAECIEGSGSYVAIVQNLVRIADMPDLITDLSDSVDIESGDAWLSYKVDGVDRRYTVAVDNDWADPETVRKVMTDITRGDKRFYAKDNGQSSIWFYLDSQTAAKLNELTGNALKEAT